MEKTEQIKNKNDDDFFKGGNQLKAIMDELDFNFDFINGVLSSSKLGKSKLWLYFGRLLVVTPKNKHLLSGKMPILEDWNTESDGQITLISKKRGLSE